MTPVPKNRVDLSLVQINKAGRGKISFWEGREKQLCSQHCWQTWGKMGTNAKTLWIRTLVKVARWHKKEMKNEDARLKQNNGTLEALRQTRVVGRQNEICSILKAGGALRNVQS